jgi:hypothetical protein
MALRWLLNFKEPSHQIARWIERLAEFDYIIEHRPGIKHGNADALSRRPKQVWQHGNCPSCGQTDRPEKQSPSAVNVNLVHPKDKTTPDVPEFKWTGNEAQKNDPDIQAIHQPLHQTNEKPSQTKLQSCSTLERAIWAQHGLLEIKDGSLYLRVRINDAE